MQCKEVKHNPYIFYFIIGDESATWIFKHNSMIFLCMLHIKWKQREETKHNPYIFDFITWVESATCVFKYISTLYFLYASHKIKAI